MSVDVRAPSSKAVLAWGVVLPPVLWWSLLMLDHHYHWAYSGGPYMGWVLLSAVTIIGGLSCFWLRAGRLWRIIAFILYLPVVGTILAVGGIIVGCYVIGDCP